MTGPVLAEGDGRASAWTAIEIVAALDPTRRADMQRLEPRERLEFAIREQAPFIDRLLAERPGDVVALRWVRTEPGRLRLWLIGRVTEGDSRSAATRIDELTRRLLQVPPSVLAEQVTTTADIRWVLTPFEIVPGGALQVSKQLRVHGTARPDAGVAAYLAVEPFSRLAADWKPLLDTLRLAPHPLALTIALTPQQVPTGLARAIESEAVRYARLREPFDAPADLGGRIRYPADAAAAAIEPIFRDALSRYTGMVFRYAVTIAAPVSLEPTLAEAVGRMISPQPTDLVETTHDMRSIASGHALLPPNSDTELRLLRDAHDAVEPVALQDRLLQDLLANDRTRERQPLIALRNLVDRREALSLFRFPIALDGTLPGFPVRAPRDSERVVTPAEGPGLIIGHQGTARTPQTAVGMPLADLPRHGFIVGTPGSGKTNTALHLCRQLWQHGVPFLVVEPVNSVLNDYRWLPTQPGFDDLLVFTVGDETVAPLRLNPFEVPIGVSVIAHISNLLACFEAAFGLWDPLPFIYRRALTNTYRRRGLHAGLRATEAHRGQWPGLDDFVAAIADVVAALGYQGEVGSNIDAASRLRAESLAEGACGTTLDCRMSFPFDTLLRRPVVLELAAVGDNAKEQALVTLLLLNAIRAHRRNTKADRPHVMLIEEAHRIFPPLSTGNGGDPKEANAQALAAQRIARGLAEDRKYGQSYLLIDQQVDKVADDAYKITNLKVLHRTAAEADRRLLGATMAMSPDQIEAAAALPPFGAFVSHNALDRAVSITVPNVRGDDAAERGLAEAPLATDEEIRRRHQQLLTADAACSDAMAPYPECADCLHRCAFRQHAASLTADYATASELIGLAEPAAGGLPELARQLIDLAGPAPTGADGRADEDYRVCVFIHAFRRMYPDTRRTASDRVRTQRWVDTIRAELQANS